MHYLEHKRHKRAPIVPCTCDENNYCTVSCNYEYMCICYDNFSQQCPGDQEEYSGSGSGSGCVGNTDCGIDITIEILPTNCSEESDTYGITWPTTMGGTIIITNCSNGIGMVSS